MFTCRRCGDRVVMRDARQTHCIPCANEVAKIIYLDERRKVVRFPFAKDLGPFPGAA